MKYPRQEFKQKAYTFLLFFLLILSIFAGFIVPIAADNWIIDGDTVYIDDENVYLSATPHTIIQDTWVTFQLRSKDYEGDIDAVWLFNTTNCKPTKPVYYKVEDGDWQVLQKEFTIQTIDFENMTKAYRLENINIQNNTNYSLKCFVDIKFNTSGKYWWGVKPSTMGWDKGYYLDPWWDGNWLYHNPITISNAYIDAPLQNFPVLVVVNKTVGANCNNGNSIRFLSTDNTTEFYYEIEANWSNNGNSYVWVNISEQIPSGSDYTFLMYYSNAGASDNQNPTDVWHTNYKMVLHMNGTAYTSIRDSTINDVDAINDNGAPGYQSVGMAGYCVDFEVDTSDWLRFGALGSHNLFTVEIWHNCETFVGQGVFIGEEKKMSIAQDAGGATARQWATGDGGAWNGLIEVTPGTYTVGTWYYNILTCDGAGIEAFVDTVSQGTDAVAADNLNMVNFKIGMREAQANTEFDGLIDEVRISDVERNASWIKASYNTIKQTAGFLTWGGEVSGTGRIILTNATTGIELTNATARGYFYGPGFAGNYNYGFWIGQTTPVTVGNADQNVTGAGTITPATEFNYLISSLSKGTQYYVRAWIMNSTRLLSSGIGDQDEFYTKCDPPTGFTATASGCNVDLAWTKGDGADRTTVVRKVDAYPTSQTDGTVVYNDTSSSYSDTTSGGSHQFYRAWSWFGDKHSDNNLSANLSVPPCPPTNVDGAIITSNSTLNITWTRGLGANTTVIVRKIGSSPSSVTDGTEIYNDTGTYFIETDLTQDYFYRLWSWANGTYSSSVALGYGALVINCYDEETNDSLYFDVFISNESGSETYESRNNTNPHVVNIADLPIGDQISIQVSAAFNYSAKTETFTGYSTVENTTVTYVVLLQEPESKALTNVTCTDASGPTNSYPAFTLDADVITILADAADNFTQITVNYTHYEYESRTYYRDLTTNHIFIVNAYLPPTISSQLYLITVAGPQTEYGADPPIENARIVFKRYISDYDVYVDISILYTDANGQVNLYLIPNTFYKVEISATGYETAISDYVPSEEIPTHMFRLVPESEEEPEEELIFWDTVTFTGTMIDAGYLVLGNITIAYADSNESTIDTQIRLYELYNITTTLVNTTDRTGENSFSYTVGNINTSRTHKAILHFNNTANFDVESPVSIVILPSHPIPERPDKIDLEGRITNIFGTFQLGWENAIAIILALIVLMLLGPYNVGIGIIGCSITLGLMQLIFNRWVLTPFNPMLVFMIPIIFIFGVLYIWTVKPEGHI